MLTIKNLTVAYEGQSVLDNLNIDIAEGMIHGLVGINGSGKTTLFHAIYGFIKSKSGLIRLNGQPLLRKEIALLETQNYFYSNLKGKEYLDLFHDVSGNFNSDIWKNLFRLCLNEPIENYSTGMKKKLALIGILKLNKPILLLDEPFNGIDMEAARIIHLLLKYLKDKGKTVIITSHILETLTSSCDYIHLLGNGIIQKTYSKDMIKDVEHDLFRDVDEQLKNKISDSL